MDVLRPDIIRIGNRCYRRNPLRAAESDKRLHELPSDAGIVDQCWNDEVCDMNFDVEETDKGFRIAMNIPSVFFKFIIGRKGDTKKRLETETRTQITIPKAGQEGEIVILGRDRAGALSAKTRIDLLVDSARQRQPFSHFLSIPILSPEIQERFATFKSEVLNQCEGDRGLDTSIFQNPLKLHLTLGTMALLSEAEVERARQLLENCREDLARPMLNDQPLLCHFRGLEYMNDDPGAVDVLYAKVEMQGESDRLQMLVDRLVEKFRSAGLLQQDYDRIKLHATVMNTLFRKDPSGTSEVESGRRRTARESFDATNVLQRFGDFNFGPYHISTIHLSQRYSTGQDGYYNCAGSLDLP